MSYIIAVDGLVFAWSQLLTYFWRNTICPSLRGGIGVGIIGSNNLMSQYQCCRKKWSISSFNKSTLMNDIWGGSICLKSWSMFSRYHILVMFGKVTEGKLWRFWTKAAEKKYWAVWYVIIFLQVQFWIRLVVVNYRGKKFIPWLPLRGDR